MKHTLKINLLILGLSIVFSLAIIRWHTLNNVPYCVHAPVCNPSVQPKGKISEMRYGFPAVYREKAVFVPEHHDPTEPNYAGYSSAQSEREGFSLPYVLVNIVFWFALLRLIANYLPKKKSNKTSPPDPNLPESV